MGNETLSALLFLNKQFKKIVHKGFQGLKNLISLISQKIQNLIQLLKNLITLISQKIKSLILNLINDHLTISFYVNILLFSSHSSIPEVFFCLDLKKNLSNTYIFEYRSTFYHNTVRVLPSGAQILGTQSSRVPKGNTQKNPKF